MARDLVYAFNKKADSNGRFIGFELGEIQSDFNMSFVIDGTKDSCSIQVWNYSEVEIEPWTIIYHPNTNTWWVVSKDKIERYVNEVGFIYVHNLELLGAIELLNARDLTDCGFDDDTYTIDQFIRRLFSLSSYEYGYSSQDFFSGYDANFLNINVDYIKTFENYTLLSALREFLNGYNLVAKLNYVLEYDNNIPFIKESKLKLTPRTGDYSLPTHNIDDFDMAKETRTMSKESFGTVAISNAQNVISSKSRIFPSSGSVRASSTEFKITAFNGVIRLPSKVYKGISLKIRKHKNQMTAITGGTQLYNENVDPFDPRSLERYFDNFKEEIRNNSTAAEYQEFLNDFESKKAEIVRKLQLGATITLYNGNYVDPTANGGNGRIVKGEGVPYVVSMWSNYNYGDQARNFVFCDKDMVNTLPANVEGVAWERGSNLITNLLMFEGTTYTYGSTITDLYAEYGYLDDVSNIDITIYEWSGYVIKYNKGRSIDLTLDRLSLTFCSFIVEYIPMSDLKIKVDNSNNSKDMQLYNQNGKQIDSVALSKLVNSFSKEITSDTITRYKAYYDLDSVPKIGSIVFNGKIPYVVNNISMDFTQNEIGAALGSPYYISCEITMSKYFATKSLLVNPNTNIRDYEIPQKYNVRRIQLYKDYYELGYTAESDTDSDTYLWTDRVFVFDRYPSVYDDYTFVMKITFDSAIGGNTDESIPASDTWYYQLDSTNYFLEKMIYTIVDFNDNNIIGYSNQNVFSGFVLTRILTGLTDALNTPISYVDGKGRFKGIEMCLLNRTQLDEVYREYLEENGGSTYDGDLSNYTIFIPKEIYDKAEVLNVSKIIELEYNKDATEVPVFEVACQVADSDDVLIGDNILQQEPNCVYFYNYVVGENLTQHNVSNTYPLQESSANFWTQLYTAKITTQGMNNLLINFHVLENYNANTGVWELEDTQINIIIGKDVAVFRTSLNLITKETREQLLFIAKNIPASNAIGGSEITGNASGFRLVINHWKT